MIVKEIRDNIGSDEGKIPSAYIIDTGIVMDVVALLTEKYEKFKKLQVEAAWFVANLSAGRADDTKYLVGLNIIPVLFECLKVKNEELHENVKKMN